MKPLLLFNGGVKATCVLHKLLSDNRTEKVLLLDIRTGYSSGAQHNASQDITQYYLLRNFPVQRIVVDIEDVYGFKRDITKIGPPFNLAVLVSIACAVGEQFSADKVIIGQTIDFPSQTETIDVLRRLVNVHTFGTTKLLVPFENQTLEEIYRIYLKADAPLSMAWSCTLYDQVPCGRCTKCYARGKIVDKLRLEQYKEGILPHAI